MYLNSEEFVQDPYPSYKRLRQEPGGYWFQTDNRIQTGGIWLFARYADVEAILRESASITKDASRFLPDDQLSPFDEAMLNADPPKHQRLRAVAAPAFSPSRLALLEARIEALAESLIGSLVDNGGGDFVRDVALPLPLRVACELIGVPAEHIPELSEWTDALMAGFDSTLETEEVRRKQRESVVLMQGYFREQLAITRHPEATLLADLTAQPVPRPEEDAELLGLCFLLVVAGYETTAGLLGSGLLALLQHPEQMELLRREPKRIHTAIEEMLRFASPLQRASFRVTKEPITIGGRLLAPGQQVSALLGSANRDERHFARPDDFDIGRKPNRHLAFGVGNHRCLGEKLARLEARIVFTRLLAKAPSIALGAKRPHYRPRSMFRGLATLPVTFR